MSGIFILSLDTEIAWGTDSGDLFRYEDCFNNYRAIVRRLIAQLDEYQIAATWAVVGHLFLKKNDRRALNRTDGDAFTDWYHAPDVIQAIRGAQMQHEIGTHTFSHIYTNDREVTQEVWEDELKMCRAIHEENQLTIRSLVFPRNQVAYLDSLPKFGIIAYRGVEQSWYGGLPGLLKRPAHLLDRTLGLPPPTYDPMTLRVGEKLVNLPASQFLMAYDGLRGKIPTASRVRQARFGLERAARRNHLYHLWFHPFNLGTSEAMFEALAQILAEVRRRREAGDIRVMSMEQAAEWVLRNAQIHSN